jgi:NADPH2:quinone reductase
MKAVLFDRLGAPEEVLELREIPIPEIGDNDVLVRMLAAFVNPGDLLFVQGLYPKPKTPRLPGQVAGNHGVGIVVATGSAVGPMTGALVAFSYYGAWAEYASVPKDWLIPLPADYPVELAAQFFNLVTAWDMLRDANVKSGDWIAVTAGHSAVATTLTQFARARDIRVLLTVRKTNPALDLRALGATEVIEIGDLSETLEDRVAAIIGGRGVSAVIDSVGGPRTGELIRSAAFGARVILYGGMSPKPFTLSNFDVLLKNVKITGHTYRFFFTPPSAADLEEMKAIVSITSDGAFKVQIGGRHRLDDFKEAVGETLSNTSIGKHLFVIAPPLKGLPEATGAGGRPR